MSELFSFLSKYVRHGAPVAITGGGGKTTLLYGLGAELECRGRVLITTTTKIMTPRPEECRDLFVGTAALCAEFLRAMPKRAKLTAAQKRLDNGKLAGYAPDEVDALASCGAADFVVAECDGSRGRSLKFYEQWEPPVPRTCAAVFAVMGADAFLCEASEENIFRAEQFCRLHGLRMNEPAKPKAIASYLLSPEGPLKNAPDQAAKILVINKWELLDKKKAADVEALFPALLERYSAVCAASAQRGKLYATSARRCRESQPHSFGR